MVEELELVPVKRFENRQVSISEYYHASVGSSKNSLEVPRESICVFEGEFTSAPNLSAWKNALHKAAEANPGAYISMMGRRRSSVWTNSENAMPRLRYIEDVNWDGLSSKGSEFIQSKPLGLNGEPAVELLLVQGSQHYVIFRALHAVMDGMGLIHFMLEVFKALQGEPLKGTNIVENDTKLIQRIGRGQRLKLKGNPAYATGGPRGEEKGDCWQGIRLKGPVPKILPKVILAIAQNAAKYSNNPTRIALPVDLRRHVPGLSSTMNYTSMVHMDVTVEDTIESIVEKNKALMEMNADTWIPPSTELFKMLPLHWMDRLASRTEKNYTKRKIIESAVVTNIGRYKVANYSSEDFTPNRIFSIPIPGNTMISIMNLANEISISVGVEKVYATDGRLQELVDRIAAI